MALYSFFVIGLGGLACVIEGYISQQYGAKKTAATALLLSGLCCLLSPLFLIWSSFYAFISFLIFWGLVVVADSPLFSTLVAQNSDAKSKGTALTIVNTIGFSLTIVSIQFISFLQTQIPTTYLFMLLAIGPFLGLRALFKKLNHYGFKIHSFKIKE